MYIIVTVSSKNSNCFLIEQLINWFLSKMFDNLRLPIIIWLFFISTVILLKLLRFGILKSLTNWWHSYSYVLRASLGFFTFIINSDRLFDVVINFEKFSWTNDLIIINVPYCIIQIVAAPINSYHPSWYFIYGVVHCKGLSSLMALYVGKALGPVCLLSVE